MKKKLLTIIILFSSIISFAQLPGPPYLNSKINIPDTTWDVFLVFASDMLPAVRLNSTSSNATNTIRPE